ncbi:hypothetical protein ABZV31_32265 [Streptomyces sp. NPDC005202]|uniref:hypothetical protein n=1 Tax=Streptomyces sp. NPDC005202 TaxID=3157021 RepID=UPI0033BAADE9
MSLASGLPPRPQSPGAWQFGIEELDSGDWIFHTRGADRASGFLEGTADGFTFDQGGKLWYSMQERVAAWIIAHGGSARVMPKEGGRLRWSMVRALLRLPTEI